MKCIEFEVVKRFMTKGKMIYILIVPSDDDIIEYTFKIDDKCNKQEIYTTEKYSTQIKCERDAMKLCEGRLK